MTIYNPRDFRNAAPEFLSVRFADKKRGFVIGYLANKDGDVVDSLVMRTDNGGESWTARLDRLASEEVCVDVDGTTLGEPTRDGRLARGDSAGQADQVHGVVTCGRQAVGTR